LTGAPSVAIVILNWNGRHYLEQFLPSVLSTTYNNLKIIIADNGSTDQSLEYLKEHFPQVELLVLDQNYGFAGGYNKALKQVQADYFVLLNSDVEVSPGWIDPIIRLLESDKNYAACQPKILSYKNKLQFEYAGSAGGWLDLYGYPFARGRIFSICETDEGQYNNTEEVFWASGAALVIKSDVYHEMEGFDEYFFAHQE
jgi:GT2 family glycosyltransferase